LTILSQIGKHLIGGAEMRKSYLIRDLPLLFDTFFLKWPEAAKPPMDNFPILDSDASNGEQLKGWEIQLALAGFTEKDVRVWYEGQTLHIGGDNSSNENIGSKFSCSFHHTLAISKDLDLKESEVSLKEGILSIKIPINSSIRKENHLFGSCK